MVWPEGLVAAKRCAPTHFTEAVCMSATSFFRNRSLFTLADESPRVDLGSSCVVIAVTCELWRA